jgi:hypothetical protein
MPANIGLLPSAALTGLTEDQQSDLQRQATTQFLLGTLLTGDPSMGYKGAMGLPEQAMSAQAQRTALEKAQREQEEINNFRRNFIPSQTDAAGRAMAGGGGPTNAAAKAQTDILNAPIDIDAAQRAALGLVGNTFQPRIVESLNKMQNQLDPTTGILRTPGNKIVGSVPIPDKNGMVKQFNLSTGQFDFSVGAGAPQALSVLSAAEEGAKPREYYDPTTGAFKVTSTAQAMSGGLPVKPGPGMEKAETKVAESFAAKQSNFPTAEKGINAYIEQSKFLENQLEQAIALSKQRGTTGLVGAQAAKIQGTPAFNLQQLLAPIQSGIAFDALKDLKANDSSLGQIAVKEFEALAGSKGSVNQGQTDAQLIKSLTSLKDRLATGRDRVTGEYYNIYKDFALTPERIAPIVEQARQNPLNVPQGFQVRSVGEEQYLVGPNKFFQKIK